MYLVMVQKNKYQTVFAKLQQNGRQKTSPGCQKVGEKSAQN